MSTTAIVVAEDLGHGYWLEDGRLESAPLLPDGAGFGICLPGCGSEVPRERLDEIRRILADVETPREIRHPRHSLQMASPLQ